MYIGQEPVLVAFPPLADAYWQGITIAKRPYKQGPYTREEIAVLKRNYPATSAVVLAVQLKRSLVSVQRELRRLGIGRRKKSVWTSNQLAMLRRKFRQTATWELANRLNKTPSEVKRKAADLGLKKK